MKHSVIMMIFILLLISSASVLAAKDPQLPVNPYQQKVWDMERQINRKGTRIMSGNYNGLNITMTGTPALGGTVSWRATPGSGRTIKSMTVYLEMKDVTNEYWLIYYKQYNSNIPSTVPSPKFVTGGDYQILITVIYDNNTEGQAWDEFTITESGSTALTKKIKEIASSCSNSSKWETALCLHDWMTTHLYYDDNYEYYGADAILRGYGVCDSYSKAFLMLCREAGIPVIRLTGGNHAWNAIQINNKWYYVDVTWDDPLSKKEAVSGSEHHLYFCLDEASLLTDHTIAEAEGEYGSCDSLDMNYYIVKAGWKNWVNYSGGHYVTIPEDILMTFEDDGETVYTIDDEAFICEMEGTCFGSKQIVRNILGYVFSHETFTDSFGTPLEVRLTLSPLKLTLLSKINVLRIPKQNSYFEIESEAFAGIGAKKVIINADSCRIGSRAFANSGVKIVVIPQYAWIDSIADDAFANCSGLTFVTKNETAIAYAQSHGITVIEK